MLRVRETPLKSIDQAIRGEFTEIFGFNLTKFPFIDEVLNGTLVRLQAKLLKRSIRRNTRGEGGGRGEREVAADGFQLRRSSQVYVRLRVRAQ